MKSSSFDTIPPVRACPQLLVQTDSKVRLAELCGSRMAQVLVGSTVAGNALWRARVHYQPQMESGRPHLYPIAPNFLVRVVERLARSSRPKGGRGGEERRGEERRDDLQAL
jgi:hypothetical protein